MKAGVKREKGEDVQSDDICLPKKQLGVMSPDYLGVAEHLPAHGIIINEILILLTSTQSFCFNFLVNCNGIMSNVSRSPTIFIVVVHLFLI